MSCARAIGQCTSSMMTHGSMDFVRIRPTLRLLSNISVVCAVVGNRANITSWQSERTTIEISFQPHPKLSPTSCRTMQKEIYGKILPMFDILAWAPKTSVALRLHPPRADAMCSRHHWPRPCRHTHQNSHIDSEAWCGCTYVQGKLHRQLDNGNIT